MKIPFDIKYRPQIESGEYKVYCKSGNRPVRIICWDSKYKEWPIIGLMPESFIYDSGQESFLYCHETGKSSFGEDYDLFLITPEPELSEFEKGYMRIVHKMKPEDFNDEGLKIAKEKAAELLDLAERQLITNDQNNHIWSDGYDTGYGEGKRAEREEALKDLPRWIDDGLPKGSGAIDISGLCGFDFIRRNGKLLRISYIEKLPGFNE